MRASIAISVLLLAAVTGCGTAPTPRLNPDAQGRDPSSMQPIVLQPAPRPLHADTGVVESTTATREEIESLIARLRGGRAGERKVVLERLVALGDAARPDLERALDDVSFESDVLNEALARIREGPAPAAPREGGPAFGTLATPAKHGVASPWVEAKYRLALEKFLAGDDLGAQQLVDAILTVEPATSARPRLERLRHKIRDHLIAETVIATSITLDERVLTPSRALHAKVLLENKTRETVSLRAASGTQLGQIVLDYEELQPDGTRALRRTTRPVRIGAGGLSLEPRARREIELELPDEHSSKSRGVVGRYRLSGVLRPNTLLAGEEPLPYFLALAPVEIIVVDEEEKSLADKPAESFAKALKEAGEARSETELARASHTGFTAALVWASQDRDAAIRAIVPALEKAEGSLERMLAAALARATGEPGSYTKEEWLAWWKSGSSRPRSLRPGSDGEEEDAPPPIKVPR